MNDPGSQEILIIKNQENTVQRYLPKKLNPASLLKGEHLFQYDFIEYKSLFLELRWIKTNLIEVELRVSPFKPDQLCFLIYSKFPTQGKICYYNKDRSIHFWVHISENSLRRSQIAFQINPREKIKEVSFDGSQWRDFCVVFQFFGRTLYKKLETTVQNLKSLTSSPPKPRPKLFLFWTSDFSKMSSVQDLTRIVKIPENKVTTQTNKWVLSKIHTIKIKESAKSGRDLRRALGNTQKEILMQERRIF